MTVRCTGYIINASNAWAAKGSGKADLKAKHVNHAERVAWGALPRSAAYLLIQNAYPCGDCHAFFLAQSRNGHSIIVKATANDGCYSADHSLGLNGPAPCIIYYHQGTATYQSISHTMAGTGGAHANFPAHPDFTDL